MSEEVFYIEDGAEVAPPAWNQAENNNRYGSVPGLPDEELASPAELERIYWKEEFGLILQLPVRGRKCSFRPSMDEKGRADWGAFATVDFDTYRPDIDKALYKANVLREEHRRVIWTIGMLRDRIPGNTKYKLVKLVRDGIIDADDIKDWDTWQLAKQFMRALWLKEQIEKLKARSKQNRQEAAGEFWESFLETD